MKKNKTLISKFSFVTLLSYLLFFGSQFQLIKSAYSQIDKNETFTKKQNKKFNLIPFPAIINIGSFLKINDFKNFALLNRNIHEYLTQYSNNPQGLLFHYQSFFKLLMTNVNTSILQKEFKNFPVTPFSFPFLIRNDDLFINSDEQDLSLNEFLDQNSQDLPNLKVLYLVSGNNSTMMKRCNADNPSDCANDLNTDSPDESKPSLSQTITIVDLTPNSFCQDDEREGETWMDLIIFHYYQHFFNSKKNKKE
jgi:hypothetical protein